MSDQDPMLTLADAAREYAEAWRRWDHDDIEARRSMVRALEGLKDAALRANGVDPDA